MFEGEYLMITTVFTFNLGHQWVFEWVGAREIRSGSLEHCISLVQDLVTVIEC